MSSSKVIDGMIERLKLHEGYRKDAYKDTVGKLTIGYGWNVEDCPIYPEVAELQLRMTLAEIEKNLARTLDFWGNLTQARKEVLLDMCYNLGLKGLLGFKNTLRAIAESRHEDAAAFMLQSKWAEQVGSRAKFLSEKYRKG
jgi:lysozyme